MLSAEDKKEVAELFELLVEKLRQKHMLKKSSESIYQEISQRLYGFYKYGETDPKMKKALAEFKEDVYISIIPLFYKNKYTIYNIADIMNCDTSTIVRNKKRLCTAIYLLLQDDK